MKKNVGIVVAVLAVVFGVFYFSKMGLSPNVETDVLGASKDWKTYDGKAEVGLTLKYPSTWVIFEDDFPDYVSFMEGDESRLNIYREEVANKKQTLNQLLASRDKLNKEAMGGQYNDYVISSKKIKVAKLPAVRRYEHADAAGFDTIQAYVKNANYLYSFALGIGQSGFYTPEEEKIYDKILSTVKFSK